MSLIPFSVTTADAHISILHRHINLCHPLTHSPASTLGSHARPGLSERHRCCVSWRGRNLQNQPRRGEMAVPCKLDGGPPSRVSPTMWAEWHRRGSSALLLSGGISSVEAVASFRGSIKTKMPVAPRQKCQPREVAGRGEVREPGRSHTDLGLKGERNGLRKRSV